MANEFEDVKINVRSLLTSSKKQLSIEELLKDYRQQEGENLPYKRLGFNSAIELLQNMKDILTLPQNPNNSSTLSLIIGDKTSHLRNLVIKQKSSIKKKKKTLYVYNENYRKYINNNTDRTYVKKKFNNNTKSNFTENIKKNNYQNNMSQNTGNNYCSSNTYSKMISTSSSNLSSSNTSQNEVQSPGFVTDELRSHLEKYISENQMLISKNKLQELIKSHPDFLIMKTKCVQDITNHVKDFLNITEKGVSLKNTNIHDINTPNTSLKSFDISDNSLSSTSSINELSNSQNVLKFNQQQDNLSDLEYINICKKQSMIGKLLDVNSSCNENKNLDIPKQDFKKNIEYSKRQSEIKIKKKLEKGFSNEIKSNCSSDILCDTSSLNDLKNVSHSISQIKKQDNHGDVVNAKILNKSQCVPKEVLFNIAKIFMIYREGVNIENYTFIYYKVYYSIFDPIAYGFTSVLQLFNFLHEMVDIRNNVLYTKDEFMYSELKENIYKNDNILAIQKNIIHHVSLNNKLKISLNVEQPLLPFVNDGSELVMVLVEAYNPSLFYLQLAYKIVEFNHLMNLMQSFYAEENSSYYVQPEHILPGSIYASSYTTYSKEKQWYRVKILREVNLKTVEVIHVDYGTVDEIPKTELRFLKNDFCHLPCQAIQCCLTGYNQLETISPEVSKAFVEIIDNKSVIVQIDKSYIFSKDCSIFHVTLFHHSNSQDSENSKSINDELTIQSIQY